MLTAIRIAKEYDIEITLDHATDSQVILDQIKESGFPCICGPSLCHKDKFECANDSFETPNKMYEKGIYLRSQPIPHSIPNNICHSMQP